MVPPGEGGILIGPTYVEMLRPKILTEDTMLYRIIIGIDGTIFEIQLYLYILSLFPKVPCRTNPY